ncbi:TetR/AcrR family transcriptional regulator [Nesterenkonia sp. HG001]|uniref:TetR/AcrR family transcriptional regulator n=1 Tax=Nesterenkonia sp. HG001 TaxID=2983207 RepID=UPI002AC5992F|nr:TetR/AcrR family transcriptional regulator C-terminal domain-containing protein [Nesterenkonia sp. HG001]MDZ5078183.1 TetR/AcrR family transcriptional regulator C-terminal domain-containing protein [Nesterenkonia sp. HG001]
MSGERTSADVTLATLRLLWRGEVGESSRHTGRGRPRALSVDRIVDMAVVLADADGLAALTMRSLAGELGVKAMTLYNYVPSRDALIDLMLDAVYAAMPREHASGSSWQQRLRDVADANRSMMVRHPWVAGVSTARPPLGPGQMAKYEHELTAFSDSGLGDLQIDDALTCLLAFVQANARDRAAASRAHEQDGRNDAEWWESVEPLVECFLDADMYPHAARIGAASGAARGSAFDPEHAYRFGRDRIIAGVSRLADTA